MSPNSPYSSPLPLVYDKVYASVMGCEGLILWEIGVACEGFTRSRKNPGVYFFIHLETVFSHGGPTLSLGEWEVPPDRLGEPLPLSPLPPTPLYRGVWEGEGGPRREEEIEDQGIMILR